jgi:DNA repair protein RecN (Recombination protein N)
MQKGERLGRSGRESSICGRAGSPLDALRSAARRLDRIAGEHPLLAEALEALDRAVIEAGEAEDKLAAAAEALAHDPALLDRIETRLFDLRAAARKHGCTVDDLPARRDALQRRSRRSRAARRRSPGWPVRRWMRASIIAPRPRRFRSSAPRRRGGWTRPWPPNWRRCGWMRRASTLPSSACPRSAGAAGHRCGGIPDLDQSRQRFRAAGQDRLGGEFSRFILALKVALAEEGGAATVIFDEIDRGVGGAVASAIGERLARLAQGGQLLAVTTARKWPRAGAHYLIAKSSEGTVTRTAVTMLDKGERKEEIARMLSGAEVTDEARAQADRLLEQA